MKKTKPTKGRLAPKLAKKKPKTYRELMESFDEMSFKKIKKIVFADPVKTLSVPILVKEAAWHYLYIFLRGVCLRGELEK